ncbi:unnamed protein product [Fusarium graminearum]|nr:unnamed protein product [Fusarium graminearum]
MTLLSLRELLAQLSIIPIPSNRILLSIQYRIPYIMSDSSIDTLSVTEAILTRWRGLGMPSNFSSATTSPCAPFAIVRSANEHKLSS